LSIGCHRHGDARVGGKHVDRLGRAELDDEALASAIRVTTSPSPNGGKQLRLSRQSLTGETARSS
jgi:hypothetical protein